MPVSFTIGTPLPHAIDQISGRTPLGSAMKSAQWDQQAVELKLRSMFSATVLDEQILAEMQSRLAQNISQARSLIADGTAGAHMDRGRFIEEMRTLLSHAGYKRGDAKKGSLQDLKSVRRLGLIWQMNLDQALGFAAWKSGQNELTLQEWPCMEFVRLESRKEPRDWPKIWSDNGGKFFGKPGIDYPFAPGRMLALRNDPIWPAINRFGVPWKPFDWGSGMGTRNVARDMALRLGVIQPDDAPQLAADVPFNAATQASLAALSDDARQRLVDSMLGDVELIGEDLHLLPPDPPDAMGGMPRKVQPVARRPFNQPAPMPEGTPLTDVLTVADSRKQADVIQEINKAIAMMDDVHGDGILPPLEIELRVPVTNELQAGGYSPVLSRADAPVLFINPNAIDLAFTTLHETGHFLDNLGFHTPTAERLYASEGQPEFDGLMRELRQSVAAGRLANEVGADSVLLSSRELFARAYAQYIAQQAADASVLATIRDIRQGNLTDNGLRKNSQWTWLDFNLVARALGNLLKKLGWTPDQ